MQKIRKHPLLAIVCLLFMTGIALAASFVETPDGLPSAPGNVMASNLSSADSSVIGNTPIRPRDCSGCPKVVIVPTSSVAGATATFLVVGYFKGASTVAALPLAIQSVTFSSTITLGGRYVCTDAWLIAPTLGCQRYDVRAITISSGNVNWSSYKLGTGTAVAGTASE